jgi:hypothetical protein
MVKLQKLSGIALAAMLTTACNSGGEKSGGNLPANDVLGNLPNIKYEQHCADSILNSEEETAYIDVKDYEQLAKLKEKFEKQADEAKAKFSEALQKEKANLVGKVIPFEMEQGAGYEISNLVIKNVESDGSILADCQAKIIDVAVCTTTRKPELVISFQNYGKDGNPIGNKGMAYVPVSGKENGATGTYSNFIIQFSGKDAAKYVDFAKVKFLKSK